MSPQLRSMLEEAADDSHLPAVLDVEGIRAAGRRAIWRQRAIVGGLGVGVTAVVATISIAVGTTGEAPADVAGGSFALEAAGLGDAVVPLLTAIEEAGYDVDLSASGSGGAGASSSDGSAGQLPGSVASATFGVSRGDTAGTLVIADFSAIAMLSEVSEPDVGAIFGDATADDATADDATADDASDGATGGTTTEGADATGAETPTCAISPAAATDTGFTWATCEKRPLDDGEIWSSEGSGTGIDAVGATVVRGDGSGFSVTLATTPPGFGWFSYGPLPETAPVAAPLTSLPFTSAELAEVASAMESTGSSIFRADITEEAVGGDPANECGGEVLAELSDDRGRTELMDNGGERVVCSYLPESDAPRSTTYVTGWEAPDPPLEAWQFGFGLGAMCGEYPCPDEVLTAIGAVPAGVARVTFEPFNGAATEAKIVDGIYFARVEPSLLETGALAPTIVRLYDAAGAVLLEGDATEPVQPERPLQTPPPGTNNSGPIEPTIEPTIEPPAG